MRANPAELLRHLSGLAPLLASDPAPDAELLERFISRCDEAAFTVLVARHGPMVLRLCRRVLGNSHDAEDAFQATFLVLARKARAIRRRSHLAAWLHGSAYRLALKSRIAKARHRRAEVSAPAPEPADPQPDPLSEISARELLAALDQELGRLPDVYRLPLVLCCLEGRTQEEAARQLGWTPGSVKGRLERGRAQLHARLARRGLALSAALLALDALHGPAAAGMAGVLLWATAQAAVRFAAGAGSATGGAAPAVTLAEGVLKAMLLSKIKIASALLMFAAVLGAGTGLFAFRTRAGEGAQGPAAKAPAPPAAQAKKPEKQKAATDKDLLQGTWVAVAGEQDGRPWEAAWVKTISWKLTIEGDRYTLRAERARNYQTGTFTLNPRRKPKQIDFTEMAIHPDWANPKSGPRLVAGIYELKGKTLKLSVVGGQARPRPTDFTTAPKSGRVVFVFRRAGEGPPPSGSGAGQADKPEKTCFSTRQGNTITLHPEGATFRVSDIMLNWFARFKNNLHLTRKELAKVENGAGDWDTEYGLVCNAALPFSRCYAHVGEEGWGPDGASFADLQVRVYVLEKTLDQVKRLIEERGEAKVKEITKKAPTVTTGDTGGWKRWQLAYERWYGDYGGTAYVDFRARQFDGDTVVFVFMYTKYWPQKRQEGQIRAMLESFTWAGKDRQKSGPVHGAGSEKPGRPGEAQTAPAALPVGRWVVLFANGVSEDCTIRKDGTASVAERGRASSGKAAGTSGSVVITYEDDRVERWTPVGRRQVVEHWFPASRYPKATPVLGIAEALPSKLDSPAKLLTYLEEDSPRMVCATAIDLLGQRKAVAAIPRLIDLLADFRGLPGSDNYVAVHAANALQQITGQQFGVDQKAWRAWWQKRSGRK
jgi:RNA polymerase sigma factor (sigma-70 family)